MLTGELLLNDIPVQCKNYSGPVDTSIPIKDLERCIENSNKNVSIVYLVIMGDLTESFTKDLSSSQVEMIKKYGRNIVYRVVDQEQVARLYLEHYSSFS